MTYTTIRDFLIIIPTPANWEESLDYEQKLRTGGWSVLLLDRFLPTNGETITISEEQMNKLGWYRQ